MTHGHVDDVRQPKRQTWIACTQAAPLDPRRYESRVGRHALPRSMVLNGAQPPCPASLYTAS